MARAGPGPQPEYLNPSLQGHRLSRGRYQPVAPVAGRLPSKELGLHLQADGRWLRFYDPDANRWLPTPQEAFREKDAALGQKDAEIQRLRQELAASRRRP